MADKAKRPERLWKYRAWNKFAKRMIVDGEIYFSTVEKLNDPFEFRWHDKYPKSDAKLDRFTRELLARNFPDDLPAERRIRYHLLSADVRRHAKVGGGISPTSADIYLGTFSVSEINDDILMWSHYADHHHGVCIGVRPAVIGKKFLPVTYHDRVPPCLDNCPQPHLESLTHSLNCSVQAGLTRTTRAILLKF